MATGEVPIKISEMLLEILQRLALGEVIGKLLQVSEPELAVLPIHISKAFHAKSIGDKGSPGNPVLRAYRGLTLQAQPHRIGGATERSRRGGWHPQPA